MPRLSIPIYDSLAGLAWAGSIISMILWLTSVGDNPVILMLISGLGNNAASALTMLAWSARRAVRTTAAIEARLERIESLLQHRVDAAEEAFDIGIAAGRVQEKAAQELPQPRGLTPIPTR